MTKENKIAIDVVLLLPKKVVDICVKVNNKLSLQSDYPKFEDGYNPHITLGMGIIKISQVPDLKRKLSGAIQEFRPITLSIDNISGGRMNLFGISKTEELLNLHEKIMGVLEPIVTYDSSADKFSGLNPPNEISIGWVRDYKTKHSKAKSYDPHITLGIGKISTEINFPIEFTVNQIGLFHLSYYCTCKNELARFVLS